MPGNGFAFPVRVGREDDLVGLFHRIGDLAHDLVGLRVDLPVHCEIAIGLDRPVFGGQIAHVSVGRDNLVSRSEIFVDCFGFRSRFHNDDVHALPGSHPCGRCSLPAVVRGRFRSVPHVPLGENG